MNTRTQTDLTITVNEASQPKSGSRHPSNENEADTQPRRFRLSRNVLVSGAALLAAIAGALWIALPPASESTDDAYTSADSTNVAPKVRGLVAAIYVRDNQQVHAGDPLLRVDPEEFDARVAHARAVLADAQADVAAAQASLTSLAAEERLAQANIAASRTSIRSAGAEADRADSDRQRFEALLGSGAVSRQDIDRYRTLAVAADQASARAQANLAVSQRQSGVVSARRPILEAALQKAEASRLEANAALDLALQDQTHTLIRAPLDGVVGNRQVRVGDYVQPGTRLLSLVPVNAVYVTANFKETQTRRMHMGQHVRIDIDALGGPALTGYVESLAPGSGSTFSLLPFEPGTGNFTKIVQRIPVRIVFDATQLSRDPATASRLRPGLSVTARVKVAD